MKFFIPWAQPKVYSPRADTWASFDSPTASPIRSLSMAARGTMPFHGRLAAFSTHPDTELALGELTPIERMVS
jgi:hypothetical protein